LFPVRVSEQSTGLFAVLSSPTCACKTD